MRLIFYISILMALSTRAHAMAWRPVSDPFLLSSQLVTNLSELPLSGEVLDKNKYWSGDFWAFNQGSINYRWNQPQPGNKYRSPSKAQFLKMSQLEISQLSPSEKLDLLNGRYDYPLKHEVRKLTSSVNDAWEGLCQGWATATLHHNEPLPKTLLNPDGVSIPFGSSDIKGLLSYFYSYKFQSESFRQMGLRCSYRNNRNDRCNDDLNAGAFHLLMTNFIGSRGQTFIADTERAPEVWNHLPLSFNITHLEKDLPPEENSAPGTTSTARIKIQVFYLLNSEVHTWEPLLNTPLQTVRKKQYEYIVDLNSNGEISGGRWISRARPDYLWSIDKAMHFRGPWRRLEELLND